MGFPSENRSELLLIPADRIALMLDTVVSLANRNAVVWHSNVADTSYFRASPADSISAPDRGSVYVLTDEQHSTLLRWLQTVEKPSARTFEEIKSAFELVNVYAVRNTLRMSEGRVQKELETRVSAPNMIAALGWMLAHILGGGLAWRIRRCPYCRSFFVASKKNSKWCPGRGCGNNGRVTAFRADMTTDQWLKERPRKRRKP